MKCRRALEEPRLGGHQSCYVPVVLLEQSLRGLDIAGTSRPQRELHALVHHLLLERRNLRVQRFGSLRRLVRVRDLALELRDMGVIGPERRLVVGRPTAGAAVPYLLRAVRLGVLVPLCESLLARVSFAYRTLRRLAIQITVHRWTPFVRAGSIQREMPAPLGTGIVRWCHKQ